MVEIRPNNNVEPEMTLKEKFIYIGEKRKGLSLTRALLESLHYEYDAFFKENDLEDLRYKIDCDEYNNTIQFTPIRKIDKLAIRGLLSM